MKYVFRLQQFGLHPQAPFTNRLALSYSPPLTVQKTPNKLLLKNRHTFNFSVWAIEEIAYNRIENICFKFWGGVT